MIHFHCNKDKQEYEHYLNLYNDMKDSPSMKQYLELEVKSFEDDEGNVVNAFRFPSSWSWCCFYGTFDELRDRLKEDFPRRYGIVQFYTMAPRAGILI